MDAIKNRELIALSLQRIRELGEEFYALSQDVTKWRDPPYTDIEKTRISLKIQQAVEEQAKWVRALESEFEEE
jgi:hypothetical protein